MDTDTLKMIGAFVAKAGAKWIGGALVAIGWVQPSAEAQTITILAGIILGAMGTLWSWWNERGKELALARLAKLHGIAPKAVSTTTASNAAVAATVKAAAVVLLAVMLGALAMPSDAFAQTKAVVKKPSVAQVQSNPLTLLQQFTANDLQAALDDANGQVPPDTIAAGCYTALLAVVNGGVKNPLPTSLGLFQAAQKVRDAKALIANLQSPTGPLASLSAACAPLVLSAQNTLVGLGLMTGAVVGTGGLGALLPLPIVP